MEQRLINLKNDGLSSAEISRQLSFDFKIKISRNAVISKAYRMAIPDKEPKQRAKAKNSYWTEEKEAELKAYIADGMTYNDIGYKMLKDRNTIAAKCKQLGIKSLYNNVDSKRVNKVNRRERNEFNWEKNAKDRAEWRKQVYKNIQRKKDGIVYPPKITYENDKFGILRNPTARRVGLMELKSNWCHFTSGDPKTSNFFYCGADVAEGSDKPYCDVCKSIMYVASKYSTSIEKKYR